MNKILMLLKILYFGLFIFCASCEKNGGGDNLNKPNLRIYNLKGDYINNVCVGLTEDKSSILVYPDPSSNCGDPEESPFKMKAGYYLDHCCNYGINSAYLSIKKSEYKDIYPISKDSMYNLILDADPYVEYYIDENDVLGIKEPPDTTHYFTLDTALLNEIITNNELAKYFTKLK